MARFACVVSLLLLLTSLSPAQSSFQRNLQVLPPQALPPAVSAQQPRNQPDLDPTTFGSQLMQSVYTSLGGAGVQANTIDLVITGELAVTTLEGVDSKKLTVKIKKPSKIRYEMSRGTAVPFLWVVDGQQGWYSKNGTPGVIPSIDCVNADAFYFPLLSRVFSSASGATYVGTFQLGNVSTLQVAVGDPYVDGTFRSDSARLIDVFIEPQSFFLKMQSRCSVQRPTDC